MTPPTPPAEQQHGDGSFATTRWSLISGVRALTPEAARAIDELCRIYWYPLYCYIRRRGYGPDDAQDLVQGYFEELLEKNLFSKADRTKGKLRAFLLSTLKHYLADEVKRAQAAKRGGGIEFVPIDTTDAEARYFQEPVDLESPDRLYDRRWALLILEKAVAALGDKWRLMGKGEIFAAMTPYLREPLTAVDSERIGSELAISKSNVEVSLHRLRTGFRESLRAEIAQTVNSEAEIKEELAALRAAVR